MRSPVLLLSILLLSSSTGAVSVSSCCSASQTLDLSTDTPQCITSAEGEVDTVVRGSVELDTSSPRLPSCDGGRETHNLTAGEARITGDGKLVTERYGANYSLGVGKFCVDTTAGGEMMVVTCDPCRGSQVKCISLCCPHGHAFLPNPQFDPVNYDPRQPSHVCSEVDGPSYSPEVRDIQSDVILRWEETQHYLLRAPVSPGKFSCPAGFLGHTWVPESVGQFGLVSDGSLRGSDLPEFAGDPVQFWKEKEFCMVLGSPPDYSEDSEDSEEHDVRLSFMHCIPETPPPPEETFINIFRPIALAISTVFMIIILIVYIVITKLRESLVGKITMGFLSNLIICYSLITDSYLQKVWGVDRRETIGCVVTGYAILYFFHSYFLWLNSMAINIWLSFTSYFTKLNERVKFILCLLYSQGLPVLLCAITALVDHSGRGLKAEDRYSYPEMGRYSCYLGSMASSQSRSYFQSPQFIYQQSVIILVQLSNLVFLVLTGITVRSAGGQQDKKADKKENFLRFVKIFLVLGFTWTAEVISTALATEHGWQETFYVGLLLDLVNLFLGVLLFVFLVCNKSVYLEGRARILGRTLSSDHDPDEMKMSVLGDTELPVQ